jgi:ABC-type transport system substrate-binding protein
MQQSIYFDLHQMGGPLWGDGNVVRRCLDDAYKVCPGLAEGWEVNSDFTQWTFKVRDNVVRHDGKPFTVEDVRYWADLGFFGAKSADGRSGLRQRVHHEL